MQTNQNNEQIEYKQMIKDYHKLSDRHVLVLETDLSYQDKCKLFHYADLERKAGNELVSIMKNNYEQLIRTKKYRKLKALYGKYTNANDKKNRKAIADQLNDLQKQYNVTWDFCRTSMIPIGKKYGLDAIFALTKAEDIWRAVEKCLYSDGDAIHFSKREDLPCIRAKQSNRGIVINSVDDELRFKFKDIEFGVLVKDQFEKDEVNAILDYLSEPETKDKLAIEALKEGMESPPRMRSAAGRLFCNAAKLHYPM